MAQPSSHLPVPAWFALRCSLAYAAALGVNGILLPFFPVWLKSLAFSDVEIGVILSLPILLRILAGPVFGFWADRMAERARVLLLSAGLSIATALALTKVEGFWPVLVLFALQGAAFAPFTPVLESITVMGVRRWGFRYGSIRVWGSIGFVVTTLVAGEAVSRFSGSIVPVAAALAFLFTLGAALIVPRLGRAAKTVGAGSGALMPSGSVTGGLLLLMIGCTLVQSTHGMYYGFSGIHWQTLGFSGSQIGLLWAAGVVAEILFFFLAGHVARRFSPIALMLFGGVMAVIRWALFVQPLDFLPALLLQCSHAFTFAFLHFGMQQKIVELVHESRESSVQGTYFFYSGLFLAISTVLSGVLYRSFGQESYYAMSLLAGIGLLICWVAARAQPQSAGSGGKTSDPS
ncbi:MFS transporter [Rhizobium sp. SL86]|uniref:MFS transporter n=1 Tax=Rhizobium sp. SL86 TaxID=2995148 RepID=UPI00227600D8|nr:MFS transporter [Rhizobium sp. SL86]MCY1668876.1 MFS transporter [Rhizobium sp. SL86]